MSLQKKTGRVLVSVLCLIWIAYASDMWADEHKKDEPPVITSDTIEMLEKGKIISFKGNVKLVKGTIIITAAEMVHFVNEDRIEGKGNIHFISVGEQKETIEVKSDFVEYFDKDKIIILTGSPWVYQDTKDSKGEYTGDRMTFFREEEKFIIEGNAKALIYPKETAKEDETEEK